jgi:hypothetical protein
LKRPGSGAARQTQSVRYGSSFLNYTIGGAMRALGLAVKLHALNKDKVCWKLQPWIVEAALARLGSRQLSAEEQRTIVDATRDPAKVSWPDWWIVSQ